MHQVVTAQLAARRAGTQNTKTRAEVRGGGAKPYRQKGTGNARQGSIRSPQFSGGGVALGPKPRKYNQKTPKKMISLALRSALSDRANEGKIVVVDSWGWDKPSTKAAVKALAGLGVEGRVLVVVGRDDAAAALSFRNLPEVQLIAPAELNAYDVLCNDWIVFTQDVLPTFTAKIGATSADDAVTTSNPSRPRRADDRRREVDPPAPKCGTAEGSASDEADGGSEGRRGPKGPISMKDPRDIILAPVVSEKSYELMETGVYTFKVHPSASKPEIRDAVEAIWGVEVLKVNTLNRKGKVSRARGTQPDGPQARHQARHRDAGSGRDPAVRELRNRTQPWRFVPASQPAPAVASRRRPTSPRSPSRRPRSRCSPRSPRPAAATCTDARRRATSAAVTSSATA